MNLILHCPACPEPGFNTEKGSKETPFHLRYDLPCHESVYSPISLQTSQPISKDA
jgi:hypothetical protein